MKKVYPIFFACLFSIPSIAQNSWYHFAEEFYFVKEVQVSDYAGKNFRYEIAVKSDPSDSLSKVRIHGIGVGKGPEDFLNSDFIVESRVEQEWTIYTVAGNIQPDAYRLWFYSAVNGNGNFYFDDVSFYIEETPGRWKQLWLFNHSFEERSPDIFAGYFVSKRRSQGVRTQLASDIFKTGKHSLLVKTSKATPATIMSAAKNISDN